jgi:integrase
LGISARIVAGIFEMPLYRQAKSPYWWIRIQVAGTKVRRSTGTNDREAAEEFEQRERERLWRLHKLGDRGATPFKDAADRYLNETPKRSKSKDRFIVAWFCGQPELKDAPLSDIDSDVIEVLRALLAREGRSPATVDRHMAVLRAILTKCVTEWGYLDAAPKVRMHNAKPAEPRWLTRAQFAKLEAELPPHLKLAAEFAVLTGLRMRSMLGLTWGRVDLKKRNAWIPGEQMKASKTLGIPLSGKAIKVLLKLKTLSPQGERVFQYDATGRSLQGKPIDDCNTRAFQNAVERAGVGPLRWHDLRHTFAAWAVQGGVTLHELMQLGGWSSYAMVLRYSHLAPDHLAQAAEKVAGKRHTVERTRTARKSIKSRKSTN